MRDCTLVDSVIKHIMQDSVCAIFEALISLLLLHDADASRALLSASNHRSTLFVDFATVDMRLILSSLCFTAAAIRSSFPPAALNTFRDAIEGVIVFLSFAVAMIERIAEGCLDPAMGRCNPLGVAGMGVAVVCALAAWQVACVYDNKPPTGLLPSTVHGRSVL